MLEAMRRLALDSLWVELDGAKHSDPEEWYRELRENGLSRLFPKLVEDVEESAGTSKDAQRYYTLRADPGSPDVAILESHELKPGDSAKLPFNQPSGSQSAALGPIIKRTASSMAKAAGPSTKIQETTLGSFQRIAADERSWSPYFQEAYACMKRTTLRSNDSVVQEEAGAFTAAIRMIDERRTVLLAFQDATGRLPGEVPEYIDYLQEVLARTKYGTAPSGPSSGRCCSLCGEVATSVFPNALRGAGINLANLDREGAFPGIDSTAAWKGYSVCVACADLLYVYWNHVAADFLGTVAGEKALVIPETSIDPGRRREFIKRARDMVRAVSLAKDEVPHRENRLLKLLSDDNSVTTLTILWAEFGQRIDDVRSLLADILPSRLSALSKLNEEFNARKNPAFPDVPLDEFAYDLRLQIVRPLLHRPGGKKAQAVNDSRRLFELRRDLADAIYHETTLPQRFWAEAHQTARWHWDDFCRRGDPWNALYEGFSPKKKIAYLTLAGWVRQLARFLAYLRHVGVIMPEIQDIYEPQSERLKPYFTEESAIDGKAKAFAFILGVLFGKLLQVQGSRGVNVGANSLTWLRRLSLSGRDLPELYVKVREKLLAYETESNAEVREVLTELGELGVTLGTRINLNETETCYFLLLGQSLAVKILPSKKRKDSEGDDR